MGTTCSFAIREFKLLRLMNRELHIRNPLIGIRLMMIKPFFFIHVFIYSFNIVGCLRCVWLCSNLKGYYNSEQNRQSSYSGGANILVEEDKTVHKYRLLCDDCYNEK